MRFLCLSAFLGFALLVVAEEPQPPDAPAFVIRPLNTALPAELPAAAQVDTTCCGSEHLDYQEDSYSAPAQRGFDTSPERELVHFNLLLTDSVQAPSPKPRQVITEW